MPAITIIEMFPDFVLPSNIKMIEEYQVDIWKNLITKYIPDKPYWVLFSSVDSFINKIDGSNRLLQIDFSNIDIYTASYLQVFSEINTMYDVVYIHSKAEFSCNFIINYDHWVCEYSGQTVSISTPNIETSNYKKFLVRE